MVIEALESVVNQSLPAAKILVLDDGSTDDTAVKVERWIASRPRSPVRLYRLDRRGAASARNAGLKLGEKEADAVAFLDSDDLWPADFLQRTVKVLAQDSTATKILTVGSGARSQNSTSSAWAGSSQKRISRGCSNRTRSPPLW